MRQFKCAATLDRDREASHDLNRLLDEPGGTSQTRCKYRLNPASHLRAEIPHRFNPLTSLTRLLLGCRKPKLRARRKPFGRRCRPWARNTMASALWSNQKPLSLLRHSRCLALNATDGITRWTCGCNTVTAPVIPCCFLSFWLKVFTVAHALRMMSSYSACGCRHVNEGNCAGKVKVSMKYSPDTRFCNGLSIQRCDS